MSTLVPAGKKPNVPAGQLISARELVKRLQIANFDVAKDTRERIESRLGPVTCKPECSYCCYAKILAPTYIGVFVYLYLVQQGMWTNELKKRLAESDREMTVRSHRGWLMGRRPCPFLKEKAFGRGTCTIYPVRPEACAITHSVASDASMCAIPDQNNLCSILDARNLVPYLPLVASVQEYCPPIITTLPASPLVAEAVLDHRPLPDVATITYPDSYPEEELGQGWVEREFDGKFTTVKDGE